MRKGEKEIWFVHAYVQNVYIYFTVELCMSKALYYSLLPFSRCRRPESYGSAVTRNMLCAGWRYGGADACQNDSGGPLVCERNGRWGLYGVVNYGDGCGLPHKYGVYAKVTKYEKWIQKIMKEFI